MGDGGGPFHFFLPFGRFPNLFWRGKVVGG